MMALRRSSTVLAFLVGTASLVPLAAGTAVNVALEAKFGAPPFLLELLETAAQENSSSYFPLLDRIADGYFTDFATEKELYDGFLTVLQDDGHLNDAEALSTFQLALSLHSAAPRIEAHYQYYRNSIDPVLTKAQDASCPVWVHFNGQQYCSPTLERAQQGFDAPNDDDLAFDRSIRPDGEPVPVSTLYVDINSPLFAHFHHTLSATAKLGQAAYRVRHRPPLREDEDGHPLRVGGYGVELQLKRTDYIVIDDRENEERAKAGAQKAAVTDKDLDDVSDLKPLSTSELAGLGLKTSSHILESDDPFATLAKVLQDFPRYSSSLAQFNASPTFVAEHESNREILLPEGLNVLWMNGLQIPWREMDAYALLDRLRQERGYVHEIQTSGLSAPEAIGLLSHAAITDARATDDVARYDWRDEVEGGNVIVWLNNIEKDKRYGDWPQQASALLQRMFPGQMPSIRRDVHNMVLPLDLSTNEAVSNIVEVLYMLVQRRVPVRFGFVPAGSSSAAEQQARAVYYLRDTYGIGSVISYLQAVAVSKVADTVSEKALTAATNDRTLRSGRVALSFKEIIGGEKMQAYLDNGRSYIKRLGLGGRNPPGFVNGVPVAQNEQWLQAMSGRVSYDLHALQQRLYSEAIPDDLWIAGEFLTDAATHRNALIVPEDEDQVEMLRLHPVFETHAGLLDELPTIKADDSANASMWNHIFVVADTQSEDGSLLSEAVRASKEDGRGSGLEIVAVENSVAAADVGRTAALVAALGFKPGQNGLVVNGRRIGPVTHENMFSSAEFEELLRYERRRRIGPVVDALANLTLAGKVKSPRDLSVISSVAALAAVPQVPQGIYENSGAVRMDSFSSWKEDYTAIKVGDNKTASVQIVGSIDPTSELAQRWVPMVRALSELDGVYVKLFLNPRERLKELPIKRFYRYVLDAKPQFSEDGMRIAPGTSFAGVPREALLNLGLDVPAAWLVSAKESIYDLDNVKLSAVRDGDLNAIYELESILIEGHSRDVTTGGAPRGVQLLLGTGNSDAQAADTLIMANLGYFQFKANPGYWNIQLKRGRSADIFNIDTIDGVSDGDDDQETSDTHVTLMSWQGRTLFPRLSRRAGREGDDVLADAAAAAPANDFLAKAKHLGQSILSKTGAAIAPKAKHADINIFSVASGHLYERMLNIMMVSVMKNTKHSVKFWFIEQFLSPAFKSSIAHLADVYGFEYELVTYKWPHWLRAQKEKQREIWGYKILFLDVLFPLDLDKVIFVDSDQIVRTDMYDLVTHDLEGAPYGFTPMCDSRTEMEGFRFWKQGYWKDFLRGLPYHISALYVVDLKRFRAMAAGDRLRGQYHQLSADPGSLSNLDQDLPNNMQMQLPIHSLPQEWLWCETWCSDESLKDARTIDLCNNPLTKEPKLDRARRQVPEWTEYDDEIADVFRRARAQEGGGEVGAVDAANIQEEMDKQAKKEFDEQKSKDEQKRKEKDEL